MISFKKSFCITFATLCFSVANAADYQEQIPKNQQRSIEQTFLTYPEWFLVHSPAEYAGFVANEPPHEFPFLGHIHQLWSSYRYVTKEQIDNQYPSNIGYHVMILVIATSTSVEYSLRWLYENIIGRISWTLSSKSLTDEDRYAATAAKRYVEFIQKQPWYLYDFESDLRVLWSKIPLTGPNFLRKWERRYALTTEYLIKAGYAKLINLATRQAYDPALLTTLVVVQHSPKQLPKNIKLINKLDNDLAVLELPRYYDFRIAATDLASAGATFMNIAGNSSQILVTVLINNDAYNFPPYTREVFSQSILTKPGVERVAVAIPVQYLSNFLMSAHNAHVNVEHVYDY